MFALTISQMPQLSAKIERMITHGRMIVVHGLVRLSFTIRVIREIGLPAVGRGVSVSVVISPRFRMSCCAR